MRNMNFQYIRSWTWIMFPIEKLMRYKKVFLWFYYHRWMFLNTYKSILLNKGDVIFENSPYRKRRTPRVSVLAFPCSNYHTISQKGAASCCVPSTTNSLRPDIELIVSFVSCYTRDLKDETNRAWLEEIVNAMSWSNIKCWKSNFEGTRCFKMFCFFYTLVVFRVNSANIQFLLPTPGFW